MRLRRLKAPASFPVAYYHCLSRVVDRQFVFGELEREQFVNYLREYETFCGVRVLTYCILSNHFHLLLEVPAQPKEPLSAEELIAKLQALSSTALTAATVRQRIEMFRQVKDAAGERAFIDQLCATMWDVSGFMQRLKQRFTQWFNRRKGRKGTLWDERFKSVLVEGAGEPLATMAAYIDLNPVRAGLVQDPKDYRWCGYGAAAAGERKARIGLRAVIAGGERVAEEKLATHQALGVCEPSVHRLTGPHQSPASRRRASDEWTEVRTVHLARTPGAGVWLTAPGRFRPGSRRCYHGLRRYDR